MKKILKKEEDGTVLVNFKFHRNVVKVLDRLVQSGLYKTRVDVVLSALRSYSPFQEMWKEFLQEMLETDEHEQNKHD